MRILIVTKIYPRPGYENLGSFNQQQFRSLASDHDVTVISPVAWTEEIVARLSGRRTSSRYINADGIDVWHPVYYYPPKMLQHLYGECYLASLRPSFERAVREHRPDVVLACFAYPDGWAAVRLAHEAGLPVVIKIIGSDILVSGRKRGLRSRVGDSLRGADALVVVSRDLADHSINLGADPRRLFFIAEGIDQILFHPVDRGTARADLGLASEGRMILFVGNILLSKGAGDLVRACDVLARAGVEFHCYLVGRGRDESRVRSQIASLGLEKRVTLVGPRPLAELTNWYGACDLVALPSYSEGIPNVLREAVACGRPFVATQVGGIPEIADPSTSVLVEPGSPEALADALTDVLSGRMAAAALTKASGGTSSISWEESAARLVETLRWAIQARSPSAPGAERFFKLPRNSETAIVYFPEVAMEQVGALPVPSPPTPARMRILVVTTIYPRPSYENLGPFNGQQFRSLAVDHDVTILSPVAWTEALAAHWSGRLTSKRYTNADGIDVWHPLYYYPPKILPHLYGECYLESLRPSFERAVREHRPDVVMACFAYPDGWATVRLAHEMGLPVVVKCHGSDLLVAGRLGKRRALVGEVMRDAEMIITVGRNLAEHALRLGANEENVRVVAHGIDRTLFHPVDQGDARAHLAIPAKEAMILFVGNILLSKGAGVLVSACDRLTRAGVEFHCYLVGRGRDESRVRSLIASLGLEKRVTLVGPLPLAELTNWYGACDVVALPSYSEGIPNVLREAVACGRPFVATQVGGIPEIADPSTSVLVEPGSPEALADALTDVLSGRMTAAALTKASGGTSSISWEESAERLVESLLAAIRIKTTGFNTSDAKPSPSTR
jgi:glycosyltransferase involved in cell wall biosynthesis